MLNREGVSLLRALIFKMWSLNEAREHGDCKAIADELSLWLPPDMEITPADVAAALGRNREGQVTVNVSLLRDAIDKTPSLFSARLNCDYQAILNEVIGKPGLEAATLADVVEAMALRVVSRPTSVVSGSVKLVGTSRMA